MAGRKVAVVGVTGAAGQTTLRILEERKFPVGELRVYASERSVGKTVSFAGEALRVEKVSPEGFRGVEVAFFSAGSAQSESTRRWPFGPARWWSTSRAPTGWTPRCRWWCRRSTPTR